MLRWDWIAALLGSAMLAVLSDPGRNQSKSRFGNPLTFLFHAMGVLYDIVSSIGGPCSPVLPAGPSSTAGMLLPPAAASAAAFTSCLLGHSSVVPRPPAASAASCPAKKALKGRSCVPGNRRCSLRQPMAAEGSWRLAGLLNCSRAARELPRLPPRQCVDPLCSNCQASDTQCRLCAAERWDPANPIL